jgi:hypothetical protein
MALSPRTWLVALQHFIGNRGFNEHMIGVDESASNGDARNIGAAECRHVFPNSPFHERLTASLQSKQATISKRSWSETSRQ